MGCGRTDTGVHASSFYAHMDAEGTLDLSLLNHKLNTILPDSISILDIKEVVQDAHARFNALSRTYHYIITTRKDPFQENRAYRFQADLDIERMNKAAAILLEYENFGSFCKSKADNHTDRCNVMKALWSRENDLLIFEIKADRFLRNMVRAIVGTLSEVGQGKMEPSELHQILEKQDRQAAGRSVPAHGLYLKEVEYPNEIFL